MKTEEYVSESGHSLTFLACEGRYFRLMLYCHGLLTFNKLYEYHQRWEAERERDALVSLGRLARATRTEHTERTEA